MTDPFKKGLKIVVGRTIAVAAVTAIAYGGLSYVRHHRAGPVSAAPIEILTEWETNEAAPVAPAAAKAPIKPKVSSRPAPAAPKPKAAVRIKPKPGSATYNWSGIDG